MLQRGLFGSCVALQQSLSHDSWESVRGSVKAIKDVMFYCGAYAGGCLSKQRYRKFARYRMQEKRIVP